MKVNNNFTTKEIMIGDLTKYFFGDEESEGLTVIPWKNMKFTATQNFFSQINCNVE